MTNANTLFASFAKAEAVYRAQRIHDDIVGRRVTGRAAGRPRRRRASA
jgi:hypothetical protein